MNTNTLHYQNRRLDLAMLKRISGQGITINVLAHQLTPVREDDHSVLIVVACAHSTRAKPRYDVLAGRIDPVNNQKAQLLSKIILKKAVFEPVAKESHLATRPARSADFGHSYYSSPQDRHQRDTYDRY